MSSRLKDFFPVGTKAIKRHRLPDRASGSLLQVLNDWHVQVLAVVNRDLQHQKVPR